MKWMDDDNFTWAVLALTAFFFIAQIFRAVANGVWG
jgi:hypothetical protein